MVKSGLGAEAADAPGGITSSFKLATAPPMTPRPSVSQPLGSIFIAYKLTNKGLKLVTSIFIP